MKVNSGQDLQARVMGGDVAGDTGTSTGATATTLTDTGKSWTTNAFTGHAVSTGGVYGVILSNTGTVLTVDRWYTPGSPGGAAASTPSTGSYVIQVGGAPAWYMALTANATAPSATDTTLSGEITTSGGGLIRKLATFGHTTGASSYTLTGAFTANSSDSFPVTINKIAVFNSIVGGSGVMLFETVPNAPATFNISGDPGTWTLTVSM